MNWCWPLPGTPLQDIPVGDHPGAFGAPRKYDTHTGVDLYCQDGQEVHAVEDGMVVAIEPFTGPEADSPWWQDTQAVLVKGASGVVLYGEVKPNQYMCHLYDRRGKGGFPEEVRVRAGDIIGWVTRVLKEDKGLPTTMLHLELYGPETKTAVWWGKGEARPKVLLDPTPFLLEIER